MEQTRREKQLMDYPFEDIREFLIHRTWMIGDDGLISKEDYARLKARDLVIPEDRASYLRAYIDGWRDAKA